MKPGGKEGKSLRAVPRIPRRPPGMERIPLSGIQMQMWFLDQLVPGSPAYHIPRALRLTGELDVDLLARAITDVVRRHEILRTAYVYADGAPWQVVMPAADDLLEFEDLSAVPADEVEEVIQARALASALGPFDFTSGRPVRFYLIKRDARSHVLVVTMHHICIDGLSVPVVFGEIAEFYEAHRLGKPASLPELEVQFADCVLWQLERTKTDAFRRHLAYWEEQLAGLPQLELPADRPRPPVPTYRGGRATLDLAPDVVSGVRALADRSGVTLLIVLAAAFAATLHRYTRHDEIVVGTATTGRNAPGLAEVVGCFVNALVLRIDVSDDPDFTELIRRTRDVVFGAWEHREVPFESVVAVVAPQRERSRNPLYQVWLQLVDAANADIQLPIEGILAEDYELAVAITPLDLSLNVIERGTSLAFRAEFATDLFDRSRVERLLGHLERVLRAGAADPGVRVSGLPLLGEEELGLVSRVWQGAAAVQPGGPVHVQVAERAAADPGAVAAVAGSGVLSFGELDVLSGRLAGRLAVMGVVAGDVVAVALERGFELLVALVGVLKAGAAFVVVDPEHPVSRLEFIFADTRARVVVSDARIAGGLPAPDGWVLLEVDRDRELIAASVPVRGDEVPADAAAYVLYTSGSTGTPKGVVVEHHALTTFLLGIRDLLDLGPGDRAIHHMALTFDWSIGELFTALVSGATLVFVAERDRWSPEAIGDLLEREHATYLGATPAMLAAIPDRPYPDLRYMVAGGEALPGDLVNRWNTPGRRFINGYGPTEAAVACSYYECEHREWSSTPPIGRPALRRRLYVLDRADNLCPIGVPGEIVVGGAGLARGYLNQPELTRQRFTPDPVWPGGRIYRTGDLGMWTADGQIQFLGRIDSQVKLNGLRIELEEIESVLADHPAIAAAAVTVHGESTARRLIGYVVPASDTGILDTAGLGGWLAARLPRYMIPAVFTVLDRLPLTQVGKIDRAALPAPDVAPGPAEPPATPTEHQVAAIFAAILDRDQISREDNFFALGGTSIQATQAVFQLRALFQLHAGQDAELGLGAFYAAPTVADIAQAVEEARTAGTAQDEVSLLNRFPVSRSQLGMWFLGQLSPGEPTFHIPYAISLDGPLDAGALQRALDAAVVRHAVLRTSIIAYDDVPEQRVADTGTVVIERLELPETLPPDEANRQAEVIAADRARQPFDLAAGPPIRATLIRTGPDRHLFVLVIHHIITDGTSMRILMEELSAGYRAELTGVPASPPPLWMSYGDYAVWQQDWMSGEELDRQLSYWRQQLKGAPQVMALPTDRPRPARPSSRAARASITVGDTTIAGLATAAQAANATMSMAFLAGYAVVLSRYARQSDLVVATQAAGRTHPEFDPMIGPFANTILLRVSLAGNPSFTELLSRIRDTTTDALAHQRLPFEKLVEDLAPDRSLAHAPLAQVQFAHRPSAPPVLDLPGVISSCRTLFTQTARLDLDLYVESQPGQDTTLLLDYRTDLFDPPWARQFLRCMAHLLEQAAKAPAAPVAQLPMLSDAALPLTPNAKVDRTALPAPVWGWRAD